MTATDFSIASQNQSELQNERVSHQKNRLGARIARKMTAKVRRLLLRQEKEVVDRIENRMQPIPPDALTRWAKEFVVTERPEAQAAGFVGYSWADRVFFSKVLREDFQFTPGRAEIEIYLELTGGVQAQAHAQQIARTIARGLGTATRKKDTKFTPKQQAKQLRKDLKGFPDSYADLIGRTTTNWAQNNGANNRYIQQGITEKQWWATADERTCPFCGELHGTINSVRQPFLNTGDVLEAEAQRADGKTKTVLLEAPWPIQHPPAHPYCRCTILPVIGTGRTVSVFSEPGTEPNEDIFAARIQELNTPEEIVQEIAELDQELTDIARIPSGARTKEQKNRSKAIRSQKRKLNKKLEGLPKPADPTPVIAPKPKPKPESIVPELLAAEPEIPEEVEADDLTGPGKATSAQLRENLLKEADKVKNPPEDIIARREELNNQIGEVFASHDDVGEAIRSPRYQELKKELAKNQLPTKNEVRDQFIKSLEQPKKDRMDDLEISFDGGLRSNKPTKKKIEKELNELHKVLHKNIQGTDQFKKSQKVGVNVNSRTDREFYRSRDDTVYLGRFNKGTTVHEYSHHLEHSNLKINDKMIEFRKSRAEGPAQKLTKLTKIKYDDWEVAVPDKFIDPYVGKVYDKRGGTEVFSMGIEAMWKNPVAFAKKDPEHFDLVLDIMRGRF